MAEPTEGTETDVAEEEIKEEEVPKVEPPYGTVEWIYWWGDIEGHLPTPINVSISGSLFYDCPELQWFNFDVYPHKIKMTNTGYTLLLGSKWKTERPYLLGGPLLEKHVIGQIHFHWGPNMMVGSEHTVDNCYYPAEMQVQVTFFKSEYITQQEALKHHDGVVMFCYMIKFSVKPDPRLKWIIEGFPKVQEAGSCTKIGPKPMSHLLPMFFEDYFIYWGSLTTVNAGTYAIRWLISRKPLFASEEQIKAFRKLWDPWDEPNLCNFRPRQEINDRHIFFISPHWNLYNSLLPIPRIAESSISKISPEYQKKPWMFPPQNASTAELFKPHDASKENTETVIERKNSD